MFVSRSYIHAMRRALLTAAAARATPASSSSGTAQNVDNFSPLALSLLRQHVCGGALLSWPRQLATLPEQLQPRPKPQPNAPSEDPNNCTPPSGEAKAHARGLPTQWISRTGRNDAQPVRQSKAGYVTGLSVGVTLAAAGGIAALAEAPDLPPAGHPGTMVQHGVWASAAGADTASGGPCGGLPHGTELPTILRLQNQAPPHPGSNVDPRNGSTAKSGSQENMDSSSGSGSSSSSSISASAGGTRGTPTPSPPSQESAGELPAPQPAAPPYREGSSYAVYDSQGQPSSLYDMLSYLDSYNVVLLGEYHDDPVAHHLQLQVLRAAAGLPVQEAPNRPHEQQKQQQRRQQRQQGDQEQGGSGAGSSAGSSSEADAITGSSTAGGGAGSSSGRGGPVVPRRVVLSLEMFERDVQGVMDEYLAGLATEADLMKDGRPWPNYPTDYRPLVDLAKQYGMSVVCANAVRRHVSLAGRKGAAALASLPPASRAHLPPLPLHPASDIYVRKIQWTMKRARQPAAEDEPAEDGEERAAPLGPGPGAAPGAQQAATAAPAVPSSRSNTQEATDGNSSRSSSSSSSGGAGEQSQGSGGSGGGECPHIGLSLRSNFVDAQNLWDAAMADSIAQALQRHPRGGALVVHVCGKFHSEQRLGICEHLARAAPHARVGVVTFVPSGRGVVVPSEQLVGARLHTYGDWLVLTDASLPRSFGSEHPV